jgi:hypothetical protein
MSEVVYFRYVVRYTHVSPYAGFYERSVAEAYAQVLKERYPRMGEPEVIDQGEAIGRNEELLDKAQKLGDALREFI